LSELVHRRLGRAEYAETWALQRALREEIKSAPQDHPDIVLTVEHPPVLTAGRRARDSNLLHSIDELAVLGVAVHRIDRGGDWTYHGPGQVVVYPIVSLRRRRLSVKGHVAALEDAMIETAVRALAAAGVRDVEVVRRCGAPGAWVRRPDGSEGKVGAVGVHVSRGVTLHGLALNLDPDPWGFGWIVPCGLVGEETTSLAALVRERGGDTAGLPSPDRAADWLVDALKSAMSRRAR